MIDPRWQRGTVVFVKNNDPVSFYGYIQADGTTDRESRVWFGNKSASGRTILAGDVVLYERCQNEPKGPRAFQVCLAEETIEKRKLKTERK